MSGRKVNSNAWGENFAEELRWELYELAQPPREGEAERPWLRDYRTDVAPYLQRQGYTVPSRAAWYRFLGRMREADAAKRILSVESARRIARGIQKVKVDNALAADMFTALSVDAATLGNEEGAKMLADAAAKYAAASLAERKLDLDRAAQATKEETLRLAREKFEAAEKRLAAVREACEGAKAAPGGLTPETLRKIEEAAGLL